MIDHILEGERDATNHMWMVGRILVLDGWSQTENELIRFCCGRSHNPLPSKKETNYLRMLVFLVIYDSG